MFALFNLVIVFMATSQRKPCTENQRAHTIASDTVVEFYVNSSHYTVGNDIFSRNVSEFNYAGHKADVQFLLRFLSDRYRDQPGETFFNIVEDDTCYCERPRYRQIAERARATECGIVNLSAGMMSILLHYSNIECVYRQIELCNAGGIDVCAHHCAPCFTARDYFFEKDVGSTLGHKRWQQNNCSPRRTYEERFWFLKTWHWWIRNDTILSLDL